MEGSIKGLLDSRPRAGRGGDNAAVVTYCLIASNNFISAAVLDFHERSRLLIDCIPVHKIRVSPAITFTADDVCKLYGRSHVTAALVRRLTIYYRTTVRSHKPGLYYVYRTTSVLYC